MLRRADFEDRRWERFLRAVRDAKDFRDPSERLQIRKDALVSRAEVARHLNCSYATVTTWEIGTRQPQGDLRIRYFALLRELRNAMASDRSQA